MTKMLTRCLVLILGLSLLGGCRMLHPDYGGTEGPFPEPTEEQRGQAVENEGFLATSARLLKPLMPDSGGARRPKPASHETSPLAYDAAARPFQPPLYQPGMRSSVFHRVMFDPRTVAPQAEVAAVEPFSEPAKNEATFQAKPQDSPALVAFLELLRKTEPGDWKVGPGQLDNLIELYRNTLTPDISSEGENYALMMLSQSIFKDYRAVKRRFASPLPEENETETWADAPLRSRRPSESDKRLRRSDWDDEDGDWEEEARWARSERDEFRAGPDSEARNRSLRSVRPLPRLDERNDWREEDRLARSVRNDRAPSTPGAAQFQSNILGDPALREAEPYAHLPQLNAATPSPIMAAGYVQTAGRGNVATAQYLQQRDGVLTGDDWMQQARQAAETLRRRIETDPMSRTFANEGRLRLLELALGNRNEAIRPFTTVDPTLNSKSFQDFWSNSVLGFSTLLDEAGPPDTRARLVSVSYRLGEGARSLGNLCPIQLQNVRLVRNVEKFGTMIPRQSEDCHPGETLFVYLELENPTIRLLAEGHAISVSFSYEVRSETGEIIHKANTSPMQEVSLSRKRDYFGTVIVELPRTMKNGNYHLRVCVNDMFSDSMQYAEEQIPIRVVPASAPLH